MSGRGAEEHSENFGHHRYGNGGSPPNGGRAIPPPKTPLPSPSKQEIQFNDKSLPALPLLAVPDPGPCQAFTQHPLLPLLTRSLPRLDVGGHGPI